VLHGRDAPLAALRAGLDGALAGRGQLALVSGEAGIGKSAIARAIAREAEARGAVVTWGHAWEFADAPPYFPVWPCLRALDIEAGQDALDRHDEAHAFRLWENVLASLARASSGAASVWVLEDLHAADVGTLDLLTFLARPLRAMRVFVVATMREKDPRLTDRMMQRLTRMARDGMAVPLERLSERDVAAITEETLGRTVSEATARHLAALTEGNPLFAVECARAFRSAGGTEGRLRSLPATVRQVVLDRVGLLPGSTRHALAGGAVLGREFFAATIARMDGSLPARVIDTLLPALRSGLIEETVPGHFIFSHTLVRDAIYEELGGEERVAFHGRADAAMASLGEMMDVLVERARHALAALPSGGEAHALALANRATALLEREGAFDRAFELHARIGEVRTSGLLSPAPANEKLHVARIARAAGRSDASRRLCEEVVEGARADGNAELLARGALLHGADVRLGIVDRSQVALLEAARAALGDATPELGCRVLARLATALVPAPDRNVPMDMAREAIRRARETGDDEAILDVMDVAAWALYDAPLPERSALSSELLDRALRVGDLPRALIAYEWLAFHHLEAGEFDAFHRDAESMLALSEEIGHPRYRWRALLIASGRATLLGHFAESDRYVTEVAELLALTDDPTLPFALAAHDVARLRTQRRDGDAPAALAKMGHVTEGMSQAALMAALLRASSAARMEDVEATRAEIAIMGSRATTHDMDFTPAALLAEVYALAGTGDERRRIRRALSPSPIREICGRHMSFMYEGTLQRVLGLLDAALGDLEGAEEQLREAHGLAVARKHAPWVAQTAYELGKVLRRAGKEEEGRRLTAEAARIARDLGMTGLEKSASANEEATAVGSASALTVRFEKSDAGWNIGQGAAVVTVKDSRGMQLLARLVERPDEEIHVLALASGDETTSVPESSAGEVLDERARRAYRQRLADLEEALSEAESRANAPRAAKLQREKEAILAELARAVGLGGRARQAGSATERARVNVQRRVKDAVARIAEANEDLGRFFERTVRTGTFCCFRLK
jgi:tetratricopeptide (TPR) repeat protein